MPASKRALAIALVGPLIQVIGASWLGLHLLVRHLHDPLDPRHLFFEGGILTIGAGLIITLICIPLSLEVATAEPEELEVKVFERLEPGLSDDKLASSRRHTAERSK